jgi:predicted acetyltransferase
MIELNPMTRAHLPALCQLMRETFDHDAKKYLGPNAVSGPRGYDDGSLLRAHVVRAEIHPYTVCVGDEIVGAILLEDQGWNRMSVFLFFIAPSHQNRSVGTSVWRQVEKMYGHIESWSLETPLYARGQHHFYEKKCGFKPMTDAYWDRLRFEKSS